MPVTCEEITQKLRRWTDGDPQALDDLVPVVYEELKRLARARLVREGSDETMETTSLVHEAYFRLAGMNGIQWRDRNHFLSMAARTMRRVLIEHARRQQAQRRGGPGMTRVSLDDEHLAIPTSDADTLLELDELLQRMAETHARPSSVMELYYFGGLTQREVGEVLGLSQPTVAEDLRFARAWLAREWASAG